MKNETFKNVLLMLILTLLMTCLANMVVINIELKRPTMCVSIPNQPGVVVCEKVDKIEPQKQPPKRMVLNPKKKLQEI